MPEDVGGSPFPDGWEPDDDRGGADEEFASVVFDEDFVRAATIHEPTAVERLLAAAESRAEAAEAEGRRGRARGGPGDEEPPEGFFAGGGHGFAGHEFDDGLYDPDDPDTLDHGYGRPRGYGSRWHRTVAWLLALVMGIGMVALAFTAVYRGASSGGRQDRVPAPASTKVGSDSGPPRMGPASQSPPTALSASPGGH